MDLFKKIKIVDKKAEAQKFRVAFFKHLVEKARQGMSFQSFEEWVHEQDCVVLYGIYLKTQKFALFIKEKQGDDKSDNVTTIFPSQKTAAGIQGDKPEDLVKFFKENAPNIIIQSFEKMDGSGDYVRFFHVDDPEYHIKKSKERWEKMKKTPPKEGGDATLELKKVKTFTSPQGVACVFCTYGGKGYILEQELLGIFGQEVDADSYSILREQVVLHGTKRPHVYKVYPVYFDKSFTSLFSSDKRGVLWPDVKVWVKKNYFPNDFKSKLLKVIENTSAGYYKIEEKQGDFGRYLFIRPAGDALGVSRESYKVYPGKSVKATIKEGETLLEYLERFGEGVVFQSFGNPGEVYYRFFLRKNKTRIKAKYKNKP